MSSFDGIKSYRDAHPPPLPEPDTDTEMNIVGKDPALSHFLPLEEFDNDELDLHTPEEWVALGAATGGTPARSKFHVNEETADWARCLVMEYSEELNEFRVRWKDTDKEKWVKRLNIVFDEEDPQDWQLRLEEAMHLRAEAEARMRLKLYVDKQPDEWVSPIDEDQVDRILSLVAAEFPVTHLHVIENTIKEMRVMYTYSLKHAIFKYRFQDPGEQERLAGMNLPPQELPPPVAIKGTIEIPDHDFWQVRHYISDNLFFTHHLLYRTIFSIVGRWETFENDVLVDVVLQGMEWPLELKTFQQHEEKVITDTTEKLMVEWAPNITATIQNDLDEHFNFYEDDVDRYRTSRMSRFFRTINLVMSHQMRSMIRTAVTDYVAFIKQFAVDPTTVVNLQEASKSISGNNPLFVIQLTGVSGEITYDPPLEEVEHVVMKVFTDIFAMTDDLTGVGDKLFPLLNLGEFYLRTISPHEPEIVEGRQLIHQVLEQNMVGPRALKDLYQDFNYIFARDIDSYIEQFAEKNPSLDDYSNEMQKLYDDIARIKTRSLNEVVFELVKVKCYDVKSTLITKANEIASALMKQLMSHLNEDQTVVGEQFQEIYEQIQVVPGTPEELQDLKSYIDSCGGKITQLTTKFNHVTDGITLMQKFGFLPNEDDSEMYWSTYSWPQRVYQVLDDSDFKYKESRSNFQQELRENASDLLENLQLLSKEVAAFTNYADEAKADEYYEKVKRLNETIELYKEQAQLFNSREVLFGMPATQFNFLNEVCRNFEPYQQLWTIIYNFNQQYPQWHEGLFETLDPEVIENNVNKWSKDLYKLAKQLKDEPPTVNAMTIKEKLDAFKPHVPLIAALRNPGLRDRHWKKVGPNGVKLNEETTFNHLLAEGLADYLQDIQELSEYASKEYRLEKQKEKMEIEWKSVQFELSPLGDTHTLKGVDDIQSLLDDHIIKTQTMLGSPYVKAIEANVRQWEGKLLKLQAILDEWLKCQNTWTYLNPIFSSGDIQKSMPAEAQKFTLVNSMWHSTMEGTVRVPYVLQRSQEEKILSNFVEGNKLLDDILKKLQAFLETKRLAFPRFYFLSNEELLSILAETKDPLLVQPHMGKCFEGIYRLKFEDNLDITMLFSREGEKVPLLKHINPGEHNNAVELWLTAVENVMVDTVRDQVRQSMEDYGVSSRDKWMLRWPGQVVICVSQMFWTTETEQALLEHGHKGIVDYEQHLNSNMTALIQMVRGDLTKTERCTLEALVVIEVHSRDVITELVKDEISDIGNFGWLAQLRYYWEENNVNVKQVNAEVPYGYEYLGNTGRLVITPLTDRCYRTLMGAVHLNLGGAPEGPAGTGKTETTKDLAKALAKQCVVYNCSDQITFREMAKLFKGLSASGAWGCFDEFNRIDIQVLSVIAQQVATIQLAVAARKTEFMFEGILLRLKWGVSAFITMNPGYAGRAELPDNLKALFRPVAMMVPNYAMIGEISLFSFGFLIGRSLARKLVATYKLCSEQLSSQDHYDYGMRAVKSVLTAAGNLKRRYPEEDENILMLRGLIDVNLAKFLTQDLALFQGILSDLFPGVKLPPPDYVEINLALDEAMQHYNLEPADIFRQKTLQVYEMVCVRHGLMTVGYSFSAKSCALKSLARGLTTMAAKNLEKKTHLFCMNPKSITMGQLYGQNDVSGEWTDGILSKIFRGCAHDPSDDRKWIVLDGPVDAIWIENMNTVLDDNKKLCLMNGDMITMSNAMNMIFEVQDLAVASPATVSRCGMIYLQPESLGWRPLLWSWMNEIPEGLRENEKVTTLLKTLFEWLVDPALEFTKRHSKKTMFPVNESTIISGMLKLMMTFLPGLAEKAKESEGDGDRDLQMWLEGYFLFCALWSVGGIIDFNSRLKFDTWFRGEIGQPGGDGKKKEKKDKDDGEEKPHKFLTQWPEKRMLYDYCYSTDDNKFVDWMDTVPEFKIPPEAQYHEVIVPTTDTVRYSFLLNQCLTNYLPLMFIGQTGTGKSILVKQMFLDGVDKEQFVPMFLQFSAQTSANQTQDIIDSRLEKRRKGVFGPPIGKHGLVFVDDTNMPEIEEYGAQPPIEILRQWLDYHGWYERKKDNVDFKEIQDIMFYCAIAPPGGGRNNLTPRFVRHFNLITITQFDDNSMKKIFVTLLDFVCTKPGWGTWARGLAPALVQATLNIFDSISAELLPTPDKSHYTFNLRDVSKVFQGMSMAAPEMIKNETEMQRLWVHECSRTFADRLINDDDRNWFKKAMGRIMQDNFKKGWEMVVEREPVVYADFMELQSDDRRYEELTDLQTSRGMIEKYLASYNSQHQAKMDLVVFNYVMEHVARLSRVIKAPFANALLIGVGGSGRQSATRLAAFIAENKLFNITLSSTYGREAWRDDMRTLLKMAGGKGDNTVFMFSDNQIQEEGFLEDISNILNTGEIPNLFPSEEIDGLTDMVKVAAKEAKRQLTRDSLYSFFVERSRIRLCIVLCMSPIGAALRNRLRKFPALVNCCTIDWFTAWPADALTSVAGHFLNEVEELSAQFREAVVETCVLMHSTVRDVAVRFLNEMRTHVYVTPTSYLELITTFKTLIARKSAELLAMKRRYDVGLDQLNSTEKEVDKMTVTLEELKPTLIQTAKDTEALIVHIEKESVSAEETKAVVAVEEAAANEKSAASKAIKDDCEQQLAAALPALNDAEKAVRNISKGDLTELKSMANPSAKAKNVIEAVCVCLEETPIKKKDENGKPYWDYWDVAKKKTMADTGGFLNRLLNYDKENMSQQVIDKIQPYLKNKDFKPDLVKAVSSALVGLCKWVIAMDAYYSINLIVKPKKEMLAVAEAEYTQCMADLAEKKASLDAVNAKLEQLNKGLAESLAKKKELEENFKKTEDKLVRATKLMDGLGGEKTRYSAASKTLGVQYDSILGDVVVGSGFVAYLGPFTSLYRAELVAQWVDACKKRKIPGSADFSLSALLGDPVKIQQWQVQGLPSDMFSTENAIIATTSRRWPLFVDPQGQANNWIKNMERENKLSALRLTEKDYTKNLTICIRNGLPVLLENIREEIDPTIDPLLGKQVFKESGMLAITIGDSTVEYNEAFRFYVTTKLPKPHYTPEIGVKVTLLNFGITQNGLQDQLLQKVVQNEEREIEERMTKGVQQSAINKALLKQCEDDILNLLSSDVDLLEDASVIDTLDQSKKVSDQVEIKQAEIENYAKIAQKTRDKFVPVAYRGSILFFCITELCNIDPMYQYSLQWYIELFQNGLRASDPAPEDREQRIHNIKDYFTYSLYKNICRSLFEIHKLLISFLMITKIHDEDISEMRFLLTGGADLDSGKGGNPAPWLPDQTWTMLCRTTQVPSMVHWIDDFIKDPAPWKAVYDAPLPHEVAMPGKWQEEMKPMQRLILYRLLRPDKLVPAIFQYVIDLEDKRFIEPPLFDLENIFMDSVDPWTPLIFILSSGADPFAELLKFANEKGMANRLESLSLGQGMGKRATDQIMIGKQQGLWVLLQNCHLYTDWMGSLEKIVEDYSRIDTRDSLNKEYRLWLTSMPSKTFPVSILQNGIKMIVEPPKGLRANLLRSLTADPIANPQFFNEVNKPYEWKKLVFGLCFFHAVVQERRTFGPLGWNNAYQFNETDLKISVRQLREYINRYEDIPLEALTYLTGQCNYGGRVTDDHDRRCLMALLADFYTEDIFTDEYTFTETGIYYPPEEGPYDKYVDYVRSLPMIQTPDIFGLHSNADITKDEMETKNFLDAVLLTMPRSGGGGAGASAGDTVSVVAQDISKGLRGDFDLDACLDKYPIRYEESMNTVLLQEMVRFNRLIQVIRSSLVDIVKAIKGVIVMSPQLEEVFNSMYDGRIPAMWLKRSYPSLKPLGGYVKDLFERLKFFTDWYDVGAPPVFWLPGFFFTQSFLTGVLQNYARALQLEIDTLTWNFVVMHESDYNKGPEHGCYIRGLFLEGAGWDHEKKLLRESDPKVLFVDVPIMWMQPCKEADFTEVGTYKAPLYRTSERRGVLKTTGHSSNFVMPVYIPTDKEQSHWVKRGCAMLSSLDF